MTITELEILACAFVEAEERRANTRERVLRYSTREKFNGRTYYRYQQDEDKAFQARQVAYQLLKNAVKKLP